jgi:hypothetical protein
VALAYEALVAYLDLVGDKSYCSCFLYKVFAGVLCILGIEVTQPNGGDEVRVCLCNLDQFDEDVQVLPRGVLGTHSVSLNL